MLDAYINLKYSLDKKVQTDYTLSKDNKNNVKTSGFISPHNLEELKSKLLELVRYSHEKEIIMTSKTNPKIKRYSEIGIKKLQEIRKFLSDKRPDITFKLAT